MANASPNTRRPTRPIFYLLPLELPLDTLGFVLGLSGYALGLPGFLDTNMLVSAMGKSRVGDIAQREAHVREFALQWNIGFRDYRSITHSQPVYVETTRILMVLI